MQRRGQQDIRRYFAQPQTEAQVRDAEGNQLGKGQSEQRQDEGRARGRPPENDVYSMGS